MASPSSAFVPSKSPNSEQALNLDELIERLAEELRLTSDVDLPHSYFVEQVKITLAGQAITADEAANDAAALVRKGVVNGDSSVFQAWAMPD